MEFMEKPANINSVLIKIFDINYEQLRCTLFRQHMIVEQRILISLNATQVCLVARQKKKHTEETFDHRHHYYQLRH